MRAFRFLLLAAALAASPALAQNVTVKVVTACGAESLPTTPGVFFLEVDQTGRLCGSVSATPSPATSGGLSAYHLSGGTTASTNSNSIKGTPGQLYRLTCISTSGTLGYLKIYDSASAPTCSSATGIKHVYPCPASTSGAGFSVGDATMGEAYANGIGYCVTGGGGDTDNTNAPTGIFVEGSFK